MDIKEPKIVGDIEIDLNQHDVLLSVRFQRPVLMIDGDIIAGLSAFKINHTLEKTTAVVTLNEWVKESSYPFNDFALLQRLYETGRPKLTVREAIIEHALDVHDDRDHPVS